MLCHKVIPGLSIVLSTCAACSSLRHSSSFFGGFRVFGEGRQKRKTVGRDLEEECSEFRVVGLGPTLRALALGVWSFRLTESLLPWFSGVECLGVLHFRG